MLCRPVPIQQIERLHRVVYTNSACICICVYVCTFCERCDRQYCGKFYCQQCLRGYKNDDVLHFEWTEAGRERLECPWHFCKVCKGRTHMFEDMRCYVRTRVPACIQKRCIVFLRG